MQEAEYTTHGFFFKCRKIRVIYPCSSKHNLLCKYILLQFCSKVNTLKIYCVKIKKIQKGDTL